MKDITPIATGAAHSAYDHMITDRHLQCEQTASIELVREAMGAEKLTIRDLAVYSGIKKTRLGAILHGTPTKRSPATLAEYQRILRTLGISMIQASVKIEASVHADESARRLYDLLAQLYVQLPPQVMAALDDLSGVDTSIIRTEWSGPLTQAITRKLVDTIVRIQDRRDSLEHL